METFFITIVHVYTKTFCVDFSQCRDHCFTYHTNKFLPTAINDFLLYTILKIAPHRKESEIYTYIPIPSSTFMWFAYLKTYCKSFPIPHQIPSSVFIFVIVLIHKYFFYRYLGFFMQGTNHIFKIVYKIHNVYSEYTILISIQTYL